MSYFTTFESLATYIQDVTTKELGLEMTADLKNELKQSIDDTVYSKSPTGEYKRNYTMRNSVDVNIEKTENGQNLTLFPNPELMLDYTYPSQTTGNEDNRNNITKWLNDGHRGYYNHRPISYSGKHFIELTFKKLQGDILEIARKSSKKLGYTIR